MFRSGEHSPTASSMFPGRCLSKHVSANIRPILLKWFGSKTIVLVGAKQISQFIAVDRNRRNFDKG